MEPFQILLIHGFSETNRGSRLFSLIS